MAKQAFNAKELLEKYRNQTCTDEEAALVEHWYETIPAKDFNQSDESLAIEMETIWKTIQDKKRAKRRIKIWKQYSVAAAMLMLSASAGYYFYSIKSSHRSKNETVIADVAPGGNKATLTLADGSKIPLSQDENSVIAVEAGIRITKQADGQLVYQVDNEAASADKARYNTITTPAGGKYQIQLPDGSKIWINAASSITYPSNLNKLAERNVKLDGEAYFEVAKDQSRPFVVVSEGQQVRVLGTHFNINSYKNEGNTRTTLIEGSVKVSTPSDKAGKILRPGQQSILKGAETSITQADIEAATGWKNDLFVFKDSDVKSVLRQIARWYDMEVEYSSPMPERLITGSIPMKSNLSAVLKIFDIIKIKYRIVQTPHGKKIIINP